MVFVQDRTAHNPDLPPTEYMHQIVMTDVKKKLSMLNDQNNLLVIKLIIWLKTNYALKSYFLLVILSFLLQPIKICHLDITVVSC